MHPHKIDADPKPYCKHNFVACREGKSEPVAEKVSKAPAESVQKKQSEFLKAIQHKKVNL